MKRIDALQLSYFYTSKGVPMLAIGRIEADSKIRVIKMLEAQEAEELYKKLTNLKGENI